MNIQKEIMNNEQRIDIISQVEGQLNKASEILYALKSTMYGGSVVISRSTDYHDILRKLRRFIKDIQKDSESYQLSNHNWANAEEKIKKTQGASK